MEDVTLMGEISFSFLFLSNEIYLLFQLSTALSVFLVHLRPFSAVYLFVQLNLPLGWPSMALTPISSYVMDAGGHLLVFFFLLRSSCSFTLYCMITASSVFILCLFYTLLYKISI